MSDDHDKIREAFLRAVEIESPQDRQAFLDEACGDAEIRRRVNALILAHERPESLLDKAGVHAHRRGDAKLRAETDELRALDPGVGRSPDSSRSDLNHTSAMSGEASSHDASQREHDHGPIGEITAAGDDNLAQLLGYRLSMVCLLGGIGFGLFIAALFIQSPRPSFDRLLYSRLPMVAIVAACEILGLLIPRNGSIKTLRRWEAAVVGTMLAACMFFYHDSAYYPPRLAEFANRGIMDLKVLARFLAAPWVGFAVGYATFIPTTGRRCAVVTVTGSIVMLIVPYLIDRVRGPTDLRLFAMFEIEMAIFYGITVMFAVFGSSKLNLLRSAVQESRKVGQYRLTEQIGAGGMGEVFKAEHRLLKRPCVVKMVRKEKASDETFVRRFRREVAAATQLQHPAAIQVYDYGQTRDGTLYYVMEYIPGLTLDQVVERSGPLVPTRVIAILRQLSGALGEAHALGLIHRDIKPSNVMLGCFGGRADAVKLLDFGLVAFASGVETRMTRTDMFLGTPAYISPEQANGEDASPKSDLYSLGAVAYFLLTGRAPFVADHPLKLLQAHRNQRVEPLSSHAACVPADLESMILRLLSKTPDDRFSSAAEFAAALAQVKTTEPWNDSDAVEWWDRFGVPGTASAEPIAVTAESNR